MKRLSKLVFAVLVGATSLVSFSSCSDDNNPGTTTDTDDAELQAIATQFVNGTVNETYKELAANTDKLCNEIQGLRDKVKAGTATDADVEAVCKTFLTARANYETSEAFLFGAATDFGIDPHIDTWPLAVPSLAKALTSQEQLEALQGDDADVFAGNNMGQELLGFHGIEFIIFRDGKPRTAAALQGNETDPTFLAAISDASKRNVSGYTELLFASAVAGDLRNKCFQMEVSWNADAPEEHRAKVEDDLEWPTTLNGGVSYGENFLNAGKAGSTYKTWRETASAILIAGCQNISDEVGKTKMGKPHSGEDVNYIESPYSYNSLTDFYDNITSIENCYMGGIAKGNTNFTNATRDESKSLHAYLQKRNPELDKKMTNAIAGALAALKDCPAPFVKNYGDAKVQVAINACTTLSNVLTEASDWIMKN